MAKRKEWISLIGIVVVALGALLANVIAGNRPALGLDLQGGASVTLQPVGSYDSDSIDVAKDIISQRVDSLGIAEPEIIRQGDTIVVNLPGVRDQEQALALVGRTGNVLVRPVLSVQATTTIDTTTTVPADTTASTAAADTTVAAAADTTVAAPTTVAAEEGAARAPTAAHDRRAGRHDRRADRHDAPRRLDRDHHPGQLGGGPDADRAASGRRGHPALHTRTDRRDR